MELDNNHPRHLFSLSPKPAMRTANFTYALFSLESQECRNTIIQRSTLDPYLSSSHLILEF